MFNISFQRVGGIRFLKLGRITFSMSVTSQEAWDAKQRKAARHSDEKFVSEMARIAIANALHKEITNSYYKSQNAIYNQYATYAD